MVFRPETFFIHFIFSSCYENHKLKPNDDFKVSEVIFINIVFRSPSSVEAQEMKAKLEELIKLIKKFYKLGRFTIITLGTNSSGFLIKNY